MSAVASMIAPFFDELTQRLAEGQKAKVDAFDQLVRELADKGPKDTDKVAAQLQQLGRKPEELREAVEKRIQKRQLTKQAATVPALAAELDGIVQKKNAVDAAYTAAVTKASEDHARAMEPLEQRRIEAERLLSIARQAEYDLESMIKRRGETPESRQLRSEAKRLRMDAHRGWNIAHSQKVGDLMPMHAGGRSQFEVEQKARAELADRQKAAQAEVEKADVDAKELERKATAIEQEIVDE
jgi:hypothetical protein